MPEPQVAEVVPTPYTPAAPLETRRLDEEGCEVVARPVQLRELVPMPVREPVRGEGSVIEDVATPARVFVPLQ